SIDGVIGRPAHLVKVGKIRRYRGKWRRGAERRRTRERQGLFRAKKVDDSGAPDRKPDRWRYLRERKQGEADDAGQASADVQGIADDAIGIGVKGPAEGLAKTHEHQRDENKKHRGN